MRRKIKKMRRGEGKLEKVRGKEKNMGMDLPLDERKRDPLLSTYIYGPLYPRFEHPRSTLLIDLTCCIPFYAPLIAATKKPPWT